MKKLNILGCEGLKKKKVEFHFDLLIPVLWIWGKSVNKSGSRHYWVNDLPMCTKLFVLMFADNTILLASQKNLDELY